jgi:hypothetical protein
VSVLGDALEALIVGRVPRIEVFALRELLRAVERILVRSAGDLVRPVKSTQDEDSRRMDLAMNDDVASSWRDRHGGPPPENLPWWKDHAQRHGRSIKKAV